jgi:alanine racemase
MAGDVWKGAGGRLTIDLRAIATNWRSLAGLAGPAECAAVVKADAYGLGAAEVAPALWAVGARTFFVALLSEAHALRPILPDARIYVLGGFAPGSGDALRGINALPVLNSLSEIEEWGAVVADDSTGDAAIHIDTGMNRLGLPLGDVDEVAARFAAGRLGFRPSLVMSHLACADEPDHPLTGRQIEVFRSLSGLFPGVAASLANSAGTVAHPESRLDLCRPGIALYGGSPVAGLANPMQPVIRLEGRVVQVREAAAGESVGYGAAETLARASRIAIVSIGYADGFLRAGGSSDACRGGRVIAAGQPCPLLGRISMDLLAVDVSDLPVGSIGRGDPVTLIGDGITVDEVADRAGTISYEMLTGLGARYTRTYLR